MSSWSDTRIQPFEYVDQTGAGEQSADSAKSVCSTSEEANVLALAEKSAYERGKLDGLADAQTRVEQEIGKMRRQIETALSQFSEERQSYFKKIEAEVVQLSLSIARRVIEREVLVDDCLLGGMVRVALERLDSKTRVRLRVRPDIAERWRSKFEWTQQNSIEWIADPSLAPDLCSLETDLGSTEIGIEIKLKEIEQSFFDLLSCRPDAGNAQVQ